MHPDDDGPAHKQAKIEDDDNGLDDIDLDDLEDNLDEETINKLLSRAKDVSNITHVLFYEFTNLIELFWARKNFDKKSFGRCTVHRYFSPRIILIILFYIGGSFGRTGHEAINCLIWTRHHKKSTITYKICRWAWKVRTYKFISYKNALL